MEDIIDIIVTETTNTIEITAQPNDEIIDVNIIDNREDIVLNVTPTVVEVNINTLTGNFGVFWGDIEGTLSNQTDLNNALALKANLVGGKVPASELPSYVDDVVEVANFAALPATGETGKIYITLDTNFIYRWTGSTYVEIKDSSAVWGAITGTLSNQTDLQNALNAKDAVLTFSSPLSRSTNTVSIPAASTSVSGHLTSTDWNTFNGKQAALNGTGFVKASGTTISYDNSTYLTTTDAASTYLPLTGGTLSGILRVDSALRIKSGSANGILLETYSTNELRIRVTPASTTFDMNLVFPSATRTYTYPNATGTIALTSDLTPYALDNTVVKLTGNQSVAGIKTFTSGVSAELLWIKEGAGFANPAGYAQLATDITYFHFNNSNNTAYARFLYGSGLRTYTLPSSDGTLALTSALASYLPLSGGTLTGALSGTSATFSGEIQTTQGIYINRASLPYIQFAQSGTAFGQVRGNGTTFGLTDANGTTYYLGLNASSGAATFSSSVTATQGTFSSTSGNQVVAYYGASDYLNIQHNGLTTKNNQMNLGTNLSSTPTMALVGTNVGIGTTSPSVALDVVSAIRATNSATSGFASANVQLAAYNGSTVAVSGSIFQTSSTFAYQQIAANQTNIYGTAANGIRIATANAPIIFNTGNSDADFSPERMRITSGGFVLIGSTAADPVSSNVAGISFEGSLGSGKFSRINNACLDVNRVGGTDGEVMRMYKAGSQVGNISVTGSSTSYNTSSDYRLKQDFKSVDGLDLVNRINVYNYEWKSDKTRMDGVLAHELAEVLPYAVTGVKDGKDMQSVDYSKIVPVMVQAIKDLKAELDTLKNK
jgi:hypothetical protein